MIRRSSNLVIAKYRDLSVSHRSIICFSVASLQKRWISGLERMQFAVHKPGARPRTITKPRSKLDARVHAPRLCMPPGPGNSHITEGPGCSSEILKRILRGTKILPYGRGLKLVSHLSSTNSKFCHLQFSAQ